MCGPGPTPESLAYALLAHAQDTVGRDEAAGYITTVVRELFIIEPKVLDRFVSLLITDLAAELDRRGQQDAMRAVLAVKDYWKKGV